MGGAREAGRGAGGARAGRGGRRTMLARMKKARAPAVMAAYADGGSVRSNDCSGSRRAIAGSGGAATAAGKARSAAAMAAAVAKAAGSTAGCSGAAAAAGAAAPPVQNPQVLHLQYLQWFAFLQKPAHVSYLKSPGKLDAHAFLPSASAAAGAAAAAFAPAFRCFLPMGAAGAAATTSAQNAHFWHLQNLQWFCFFSSLQNSPHAL